MFFNNLEFIIQSPDTVARIVTKWQSRRSWHDAFSAKSGLAQRLLLSAAEVRPEPHRHTLNANRNKLRN